MKRIYVCENPYVLYKILIKAVNSCDDNDIIISDNMPQMQAVVPVLEKTDLFSKVMTFHYDPNDPYNTMKVQRSANAVLQLYYFVKRYFKATFHQKALRDIAELKSVNFQNYDSVYVSDFDVSIINGFLACNHIEYTMMEHGKYVFRKDNIGLVYNSLSWISYLLEKMHLVVGIRIATRFCKYVEVHENKDLGRCLKMKRIVEWNVDKAIKELSTEQKECIFSIYARAYDLTVDYKECYSLLLTNPLYLDGFVDSEEKQAIFYKEIVEKYMEGSTHLLIKPHPRDRMDYRKHFPAAIIVNSSISSEILLFSRYLRLDCVLTFYSTSIHAFAGRAKKVICLANTEQEARKMNLDKI